VTRFVAMLAIVAVAVAGGAAVVSTEPDWYLRIQYPLAYEPIVRGHARNYGLEPALVAAVIYQESKFQADAESESGAVGLMQVRPETAEGIALRTGGSAFEPDDLYDPELNVRYGCWYLRHLLRKYDDQRLALAAYNAGQANVDEWLREEKGIAFAETRHYVRRVERLQEVYRDAYGL
jgi:soluble lytic murein transglycosylase